MNNTFDNIERRRYYGIRVGDIVSPKMVDGSEWKEGSQQLNNNLQNLNKF